MSLVDYASSEESETEEQQPILPTKAKQKKTSAKPAFPKLVDSSNPHKIKVNLSIPSAEEDRQLTAHEPPAKRVKVGKGGGGYADFNSLLPAPKRAAAPGGLNRGGLGKGVNLKTGATPGFTREPMPAHEPETEQVGESGPGNVGGEQDSATATAGSNTSATVISDPQIEQSKKKATMFKPLSVGRKPQKKKPPLAQDGEQIIAKPVQSLGPATETTPNVCLFPSYNNSTADAAPTTPTKPNSKYKSVLYQPSENDNTDESAWLPQEFNNPDPPKGHLDHSLPHTVSDQSLDAIATSLNLTPGQKRQLLGRNAAKSSAQAIKVTNFNTDAEYAANEALRQSGETVQHTAVRPIAGGGKHSLKQLVSSAVGQKDALEESFAEGSRNRKEGAGRYGW